VASNSAQLVAHAAAAKANSSINAIYLDPAGGTFTYPNNLLAGLNRTPDNPLVIRTKPGSSTQAVVDTIQEVRFLQGVAYVDLKILNVLTIRGGGADILIERCVGRLDLQGMRVNGVPTTPITNLQVRLNVVADAWTMSASALIHGLFVYNVDGLLLEGNIFDHNGWNPTATRATAPDQGGATSTKHNIYIARPGSGLVARYNYVARASSHGIHIRNGGYVNNNLFVRNPIAWQYGYGGDGNFTKYGLSSPGIVEENVTLDADDLNTSLKLSRGINGWLTNARGVTIDDNVALDNTTSPTNDAFLQLDRNFEIGAVVSNNIGIDWGGGLRVGSGTAPMQYTQINNDFAATGLTSAAQSLADSLKTDSYITRLKLTRARLGVDIGQLKRDMATIRSGIIP
jgi:hypothetical protein